MDRAFRTVLLRQILSRADSVSSRLSRDENKQTSPH
jgi:hypothetical protein